MTQGGDEGKWWRREVVRKGSGEEGKWWWREVVRKGKWLWREVVTKGSGEEGKGWRWKVVTEGSGDEGNAAKCIVMAAWVLHGLCFGEEAGARNLAFFRVKWLQPTMKGTSSVRRVRLRSVCLFFFCRIVTVASCCFGCACVCIVVGCFGICACRSHWNGCMTVVIWWCHVRRYVQVCDVILRNAL